MFNRFRRKEAQVPNEPVPNEPETVEKQQGFICPMCMTSLPGPAELQAHFEKVHDESNDGESFSPTQEETDALPEDNEQLLTNISKGSLEIDLDANAPDSEKVILLLRQELTNMSVELKEEKWYAVQLKSELDKVNADRDKIEEEKQLVEKEYQSQLRSAEEGFFEVVEENKKLKEDLVFADYNTTKERHEKLKQQAFSSQSEADEERMTRAMLEEDNRLLKEKFLSMQNSNEASEASQIKELIDGNKSLRDKVSSIQAEKDEESLRREGLEAGVNMLKEQVTSQKAEILEEQEKRKNVESDFTFLQEKLKDMVTSASVKEKKEKELSGLQKQEKELREASENELQLQLNNLNAEKSKREAAEKNLAELKAEKEKVDSELHKVQALLEQEIEKCCSHMMRLDELQEDLNKEREKSNEMETEHAEQLKKMEKGDQGAVIEELSIEKQKLLETIASMESTMTLKLKEQSGEIVNIRQEKMEVMVELRENQLECGKLKEELRDTNESKKEIEDQLSNSGTENESLRAKLKESEESKEKVNTTLEEIENEKEKLKVQLADGNDEKEMIMNELRKYQDEVKRVGGLLTNRNEELVVCQKEIVTLNAKVKDFETSNSNLNGLVLQKDETIAEMKTIHADAITQMSTQMKEESLKLQNEIDLTKKYLVDVTGNLENTTQELNTKKEEVEVLNEKIVEYEAKNTSLETSLEQKEDVLLGVHTKLEAAEQELKKPCDSCQNYEIQLCRLQEETRDSQGQIEKLKKEFQEFSEKTEEEKQTLNSTISDLEARNSSLDESVQASVLRISELEVQVTGLNSEKELFVGSALQAEEKISLLDEETSNLRSELSCVKDQLLAEAAEKEEKTKELEEQQILWISERNLLLEEGEELKINLLKARDDHSETTETFTALEGSLRSDITSLQTDISQLQNKLETSEVEHQNAIRSKEELQANLKGLQVDLSKHSREIAEYEAKLRTSDQQINQLKGDVNELQTQLGIANNEKENLMERVLSGEEQHKKTKQRLTETNRKLDQSLSALQELGQENQNMQVTQVLKSSRQWVQDEESNSCKKCDKAFSLTVRKHHCRQCGHIFCSECSGYQAVIASSKKPVRVCEACSNELSGLRGSNVRRLSNASTISTVSNR